MAKLDPKFVAQCLKLAQVLDKFDYYKLLQLDRQATLGQIRKAYHKQSRIFHPDRYYHMEDQEFKQAVYSISKRVTEAYVTLRDAEKRRFYDQELDSAGGAAVRYTEESAQKQKQAKKEETGTTEQGRRMYRQGLQELKRKDYKAAERSFQMAMAYEQCDTLPLKHKADEAGSQIKTDFSIR